MSRFYRMNEDTFLPKLSDILLCNYYSECNHKALGTRILKRKTSLRVKNYIGKERKERGRKKGRRGRQYKNALSIKTRQI